MKVYVVATTVKGKVHDVEVFWERWKAASLMRKSVETLNAKGGYKAPVVWTDEDEDGIPYRVKADDIVSEIFVREI